MPAPEFEAWLKSRVDTLPESPVREAAAYSLLAGGKRIRPALLMEAAKSYGLVEKETWPMAGAIEMVHTYSLIHDDLPAMDNDDLRRGKPTCHIQYGEDNAILAGDALLTLALTEAAGQGKEYAILLGNLANGMVYGQSLDLQGEKDPHPTTESLMEIDRYKTGCLLQAPLVAAAMLAGHPEDIPVMEKLGELTGIAFQIQDDILDVTSTPEIMGKSLSDADLEKATFVRLLGLEPAKAMVEGYRKETGTLLDRLHLQDKTPLQSLIQSIYTRDH